MKDEKSNIILIGMAGSGKSTIGRLLAGHLGLGFLDTDALIEQAENRPLQEIIDSEGPVGFRAIEEKVLLAVDCHDHVIATGGSSIYSRPGMEHLRRIGQVILLKVEPSLLAARVGNASHRGLVKRPDQSFAELFAERRPLYDRYADYTVDCGSDGEEAVSRRIINLLGVQSRSSGQR